MLTTLTPDAGKILSKLHAVQPRGTINFCTGIRVAHVRPTCAQKYCSSIRFADVNLSQCLIKTFVFPIQLALKHRQGKNHKMRIIAFVGSPVEDTEKDVRIVMAVMAAVLLCLSCARLHELVKKGCVGLVH